MRIRFENIGPVGKAYMTLGDLTIIAGQNNTGKTYLTYALYGFLRSWMGWPSIEGFFLEGPYRELQRQRGTCLPSIPGLARSIVNGGRALQRVDNDHFLACRRLLLQHLSKHFSTLFLPSVFSSSLEDFYGTRIAVELPDSFLAPTSFRVESSGNRRLRLHYRPGEIIGKWEGDKAPAQVQFRMVAHGLFRLLCSGLRQPFVLLAERFGISLFHRELDLAKSKINDYLQMMGAEDGSTRESPFRVIDETTGRYALPVKDNIEFTMGIPANRRRLGPLAQRQRVFNHIKDMMGGYYKTSGDDILFRSKSRGDNAYEIPLHLASASARGLSDFYFYLKYIAVPNHLLIIDEPESHLDTRNQIQFARLLSRLVGLGFKVLITTHSDYLLKEINNLIMLSHLPRNSETMLRKLKYDKSDALPASRVRAYIAEEGTLVEASITKFGMEMPHFDKAIDEINTTANTLGFALSG